MANAAFPVTVGTIATLVSGEVSAYDRDRKTTTVLRPLDGVIYVGGPGVTVAAGLPVRQDEVFALDSQNPLYAIAESDVAVRVLRVP